MNKYILYSKHDTGGQKWEDETTIFAADDDEATEKAEYYYRHVFAAAVVVRVTRESRFGELIGSLP